MSALLLFQVSLRNKVQNSCRGVFRSKYCMTWIKKLKTVFIKCTKFWLTHTPVYTLKLNMCVQMCVYMHVCYVDIHTSYSFNVQCLHNPRLMLSKPPLALEPIIMNYCGVLAPALESVLNIAHYLKILQASKKSKLSIQASIMQSTVLCHWKCFFFFYTQFLC